MSNPLNVIAIALYRMTDPEDGAVYTKAFCKEMPLSKFEALDDDSTFRAFYDEIDEEWELSNGLKFELLKLTH